MIKLFSALMLACALAAPLPMHAAENPEARALLAAAVDAAGGDTWLNPQSLLMEGTAVFYAPDGVTPRSISDDYRMWRAMNPDRTVSHGADGKVRITARSKGQLLFEVGYDGDTTWTEKGVMPRADADAYWAANFGFGIIRQAGRPGFVVEAAPARNVEGHALAMIRIIGPDGGRTLFGLDRKRHYIRYMAFDTPRGFHERVYDGFYRLKGQNWVQPRTITLFYDGVMANRVTWTRVTLNAPMPDAIFAWPGATQKDTKP
ncbi:MAG: hypothetical protein RLZZ58_608 [Pseudomonadota bacterium]